MTRKYFISDVRKVFNFFAKVKAEKKDIKQLKWYLQNNFYEAINDALQKVVLSSAKKYNSFSALSLLVTKMLKKKKNILMTENALKTMLNNLDDILKKVFQMTFVVICFSHISFITFNV